MRRKYKATGCAKFLVFLLIFGPLTYVGASYYHGENGIQKVKDVLGVGRDTPHSETHQARTSETTILAEELEQWQRRVQELESELYRKNVEIDSLKAALADQAEE